MARVTFTPVLARHVVCPIREADGSTVRAVLDHIFAANPMLGSYVLDEHRRLRKHVSIYVNGRGVADRVSLADPVESGDEIHVLQALSGG